MGKLTEKEWSKIRELTKQTFPDIDQSLSNEALLEELCRQDSEIMVDYLQERLTFMTIKSRINAYAIPKPKPKRRKRKSTYPYHYQEPPLAQAIRDFFLFMIGLFLFFGFLAVIANAHEVAEFLQKLFEAYIHRLNPYWAF